MSVSEPYFAQIHSGELGSRYCIWHEPTTVAQPLGLVIHVHGFAEEMNKSRRMAAAQARELATQGFAVLQLDLLGCGDSAGDFSEATWSAWLNDVVSAVDLARARHSIRWPTAAEPDLWLWGHRAGCLLATQAARLLPRAVNFLFWQPTPSGKAVLQQFLRLQSAASMLGKDTGKPPAKDQLAAGLPVEIGGYLLNPALASGLQAARLLPAPQVARMIWLDVAADTRTEPSPSAAKVLAEWQAAGFDTEFESVAGPSFWQTTEIEHCPQLVAVTVSRMVSAGRINSPEQRCEPPACKVSA